MRSSKSYSSRRDSSRFLVDDARETITLNVVGAYLQALRAKASRDTLTEQTRLAQELHKITADRFSQGVASQLDENRAKQQVNSLEQQRLEAEQGYVAAKLNLANLLHANITDNFEVSDETAYGSGQTTDRAAAVQQALTNRPDYRAAEASVRAAELEISSVEATRLPTLQLTLDDGQSGNSPVHNNNTYRVQGTLHVPIFTGGRIRAEIRDAKGALDEATALRDRTRAQIETDVLTAVSGVEWALRQLETSVENVSLSRRELELTRERFVQGIADNTEVVNSQDRLSRADDANIRAQYMLGLSRANLARASGGAERTYRK
jgi:outer membrane protein TolC